MGGMGTNAWIRIDNLTTTEMRSKKEDTWETTYHVYSIATALGSAVHRLTALKQASVGIKHTYPHNFFHESPSDLCHFVSSIAFLSHTSMPD